MMDADAELLTLWKALSGCERPLRHSVVEKRPGASSAEGKARPHRWAPNAWPPIGLAAAIGLTLFFIAALITHLRARDYSLGLAVVFLLLAVGALVLRLTTVTSEKLRELHQASLTDLLPPQPARQAEWPYAHQLISGVSHSA